MTQRKTPWATLILTTVTLVTLIFGLWELIEHHFFTRLDPVRFHVLYITRGIASSVILVAWAVWYVLRHRRAYEEELQKSEAKYRGIVDNSRDAISLVDAEGRVVEWNKRAEESYGYTRTEALGSPSPAIPADRMEEWRALVDEAVRGKAVRDVETSRRDRGGRRVDVSLSLTPLPGPTGAAKSLLVVERDVTEEKARQMETRQTERLAAIGRMAAKVAHEIRNPLGALSLNVELLEGSPLGSPEKKVVRSLMTEVDRLNNVVEDYLSFSRMSQPTLERFSLNEVLSDLIGFLTERISRDGVRIVSDLDDGLPRIEADRHQLRTVFLNIIKNALEAMPQGGELRVESGLPADNPGYLRVSVTDTGTGILPENLPHIFEHFFTTKPGGTGLGLAISRQIVQEHGGTLECRPAAPHGTRFTVSLPIYWRKG